MFRIRIKLIVYLILVIILMNGCVSKESTKTLTYIENSDLNEHEQVQKVVNSYIEIEGSGEWKTIGEFLSGEALGEAKNNLGRRQVGRKILSTHVIDTQIVSPTIATVITDISLEIQDNPIYKDRYCVKYSLSKEDESWRIYKAEVVEMNRPDLSPGTLPNAAKKVLEEYFSMPYELKKYHETNYLAGEALPVLTTESAGIYRRNPPSIISKGFKVLKVESMGTAEGYCVAKVAYIGGNRNITDTAIVDLVDIAGQWKIIKVAISQHEIT